MRKSGEEIALETARREKSQGKTGEGQPDAQVQGAARPPAWPAASLRQGGCEGSMS